MASDKAESAKEGTGLDDSMELAYSDSQSSKALLVDDESGLRGRPDQIVIIDGDLVPVEQKTGKIPKKTSLFTQSSIVSIHEISRKNNWKNPSLWNYQLWPRKPI